MSDLWDQLVGAAGLPVDSEVRARLGRYLDELLAANARMNLTAIRGRAEAEVAHVADALTVLPYLPKAEFSLVDVGSGGGVPGLPLAIARPDAQVTLIEATQKKARFLREAAAAIGLTNVTVIDQRAEDVARGPLRESFDVATARAVAPLSLLVEWCLPLVKVGGKLLAMKGGKVQEELPEAANALKLLNAGTPAVYAVTAAELAGHVIVEVAKAGATDARWPRGASVAKKRAL